METQTIRIGNDIRLAVDLRQYIDISDVGDLGYLEERKVYNPRDLNYENKDVNPYVNKHYEVYYPNQYKQSSAATSATADYIKNFDPEGTPINIRSVKAFLINTSKMEEREQYLKNKTRFIARYPIEPGFDAFQSTEYDICNSGYPTYRAYPHHYMVAPYHGYGVRPDWAGIRKPLPAINGLEYRAKVCATKYQNVIEVDFPAYAQLYTGMYKLVIVAQIYAPGYNRQNLKTITVDIPDVIKLVKTSEEAIDSDVRVYVGKIVDILGTSTETLYVDNYVKAGTFNGDDHSIKLNRTDGHTVSIDTSELTEWAVVDE